jgi:hypothetical protein
MFVPNSFGSIGTGAPAALCDPADETVCREVIDSMQAVAVYRRLENRESAIESALANDELESLSIDDLRLLAGRLLVPERSKITEKAELIAQIRRRV